MKACRLREAEKRREERQDSGGRAVDTPRFQKAAACVIHSGHARRNLAASAPRMILPARSYSTPSGLPGDVQWSYVDSAPVTRAEVFHVHVLRRSVGMA
jgi:hypothetical protein